MINRAQTQREKLRNAIVFFSKNTRACYKLKLFKLLFFFDFEVYRQTGRSATGLQYFAWPMGPVPNELFEEINAPRDDLTKAVTFRTSSETDPDFTDKRLLILARVQFDEGCFTPRELKVMEQLAEIYRDASGKEMKDASHERGGPWDEIYEVQKQRQALIPYELALRDSKKSGTITKEQADEIAEEEREIEAMFK